MHLVVAAVAAFLAVLAFLMFRRKKKMAIASPADSSPAVDKWLAAELPAALAVHLAKKGIERSHIASTLAGDPDPSVVSAIEQGVRAIELEYRRDPHVTNVEVRARIRFDDGTEENISKSIAYEDVPASVREDFELKATTRAFRKWQFSWIS